MYNYYLIVGIANIKHIWVRYSFDCWIARVFAALICWGSSVLVHHMASEELFPSADDIVGAGFLDRLEGMDSGDHAFYHRKTKKDSEVGDLFVLPEQSNFSSSSTTFLHLTCWTRTDFLPLQSSWRIHKWIQVITN